MVSAATCFLCALARMSWTKFWAGWQKLRNTGRTKPKGFWESFNDEMKEWERKEQEVLKQAQGHVWSELH